MEGDGGPARRQSFKLKGKNFYIAPGDKFIGGSDILAGTPAHLADLCTPLHFNYDPVADLTAASSLDRYAAAKAVMHRADAHTLALPILEGLMDHEMEHRVALEAAGTATFLGSSKGEDFVVETINGDENKALSMEAIFILSELKGTFARDQLIAVASDPKFQNDERRQAAVWGLGKSALKSYSDLLPFIADTEEDVAYHAISAFGGDTPEAVINRLIELLVSEDSRTASAASKALLVIGSRSALARLIAVASVNAHTSDWVLATIGRFCPQMVREELAGSPLLHQLAPMLLVANGANWLTRDESQASLRFLSRQFV